MVRGAESTTMPDGSVLAYVVVMVSPATPGFGSKMVPSTFTVHRAEVLRRRRREHLVRRPERVLSRHRVVVRPGNLPQAQTPDAD